MCLQPLPSLALGILRETLKRKENGEFCLNSPVPFPGELKSQPQSRQCPEANGGPLRPPTHPDRKFHTHHHCPGRRHQPLTIRRFLRSSSFISFSPPASNSSWVSVTQPPRCLQNPQALPLRMPEKGEEGFPRPFSMFRILTDGSCGLDVLLLTGS